MTALATLMFELVASRLADFHLGAGNAYLAIPVTFLGLALGSLHVHVRPRLVERFRPFTALAVLAATCFAAMLLAFVVFGKYLPVVSALQMTHHRLYLLYKTLAFIGLLLAPFYYFGRILTIAYQTNRKDIGAIYSADFWGAALACAVTPLLFHFGGLPNVSLVLLALICVPVVVFFKGKHLHRLGIGLLLVAACVMGSRVITIMDSSLDYSRYNSMYESTEITHAWNEHSRVAVLSRRSKNSSQPHYRIVHDNSRSNVHVWAYQPKRVGRRPTALDALEVPVTLRRPTANALVVFAGCGAEMVALNELLGGKTRVTGIELNRLVRDLAVETPKLRNYRLQEFYELPQIDLVIDEGRHFLSTTDEKYDLIFVGSNAATGVWLTGHSRKYLDTAEAFGLYLDRLAEGGILIFDHQPVARRLETMKKAFEDRGLRDFSERVVVLQSEFGDDMLVSPSGFSETELRRLLVASIRHDKRLLYVPGRKQNNSHYSQLITGPIDPGEVMDDDRPFLVGLNWREYSVIPDADDLRRMVLSPENYIGWIKISTLLILVVISGFFIAIAGFRRSAGLPPSLLVYLLISGFCFMLIEIAVIAKLELVLQNPIVSMATVLSTFLATSGIGSRLFPRVEHRIRIGALCLMLAALLVGSIYLLDFLSPRLLGTPLAVRLVIAVVVMSPIGVSLGLFYPYAVTCLTRNGRPHAVAITYGISTLSGVIGASYAMTAMLDVGFSSLLWQAAAGYVLLAMFATTYSSMNGRFLTLPSGP